VAAVLSVRRRLVPICYLGALAVAVAGWLWAIGWATVELAKWLLS
jgi:hypothetical protein